MAERDYKKERQWEKEKYKLLRVKLDKDVAEVFIEKLDGKPYAVFIKEKIEEFLKKD